MGTYLIGDIQGCYEPLRRLLDKIRFDPKQDQLWFAGDLVNRGKHSLETLRFVRSLALENAALSVLGNHDISLIAAVYGLLEPHKSLRKLLDAPDLFELIDWLRQRPFMHVDEAKQAILVHAGISPEWDLANAQTQARRLEQALQQENPKAWLELAYGNKPTAWRACHTQEEQDRYSLNAFTRMRYCLPDASLEFQQKLNPNLVSQSQTELIPWFRHPSRLLIPYTICFGHWSTLGYYQEHNIIALDTGCVWGGTLTALNIDTKNSIGQTCHEYERREKG